MCIIAIVIVGYLGLGLFTGFVNCVFNTRFYRSHPSNRLIPLDNAACDFLFRSMFFWPWFVACALYAALPGPNGDGRIGDESKPKTPNHPASDNAGIASRLAIAHPWPGVPDPLR
jgi:hypothetical protein